MICKNLSNNKYFNYTFASEVGKVELNDGKGNKWIVSYKDWCENYLIIDKWRDLSKYDIKYNEELENGKISSS